MTEWLQKTFTLSRCRRGFHLVTGEIEQQVPELGDFKVGIAQVFIHHTSASLTLNENADPTVRADFESHFETQILHKPPLKMTDLMLSFWIWIVGRKFMNKCLFVFLL